MDRAHGALGPAPTFPPHRFCPRSWLGGAAGPAQRQLAVPRPPVYNFAPIQSGPERDGLHERTRRISRIAPPDVSAAAVGKEDPVVKKDRPESGFTLVEMMIAVVLVTIIFGLAIAVVVAGQNAMGGSSLTSEMQDYARRCLNDCVRQMMATGLNSPDFSAAGVDPLVCEFRECMGYDVDNMTPIWDPPIGQGPRQVYWEDDTTSGKPDDCSKDLVFRDDNGDINRFHWISNFKVDQDIDDPRKITLTIEITRADQRVGDAGKPTKRTIERTETIFLRN